MGIYIVGGSNSLMRSGWSAPFARKVPDTVNLSLGGNTSLAGLYRLLVTPEIGPGDTVVWEYALNDVNHLDLGIDEAILLRQVEEILIWCRAHGVAVAPVIFTPQPVERRPERVPYLRHLHGLFAAYRLAPYDASLTLRAALGVATLPDRFFADVRHYSAVDGLQETLCTGVEAAVARARIPAPGAPLRGATGRLVLVHGAPARTYSNALLTVPVADPPFEVALPGQGEIVGMIILTGLNPAPLTLTLAGARAGSPTEVRVLNVTSGDDRLPHLLRAIGFETRVGRRWQYGPQARLHITQPAEEDDRPGLRVAGLIVHNEAAAPAGPPDILPTRAP